MILVDTNVISELVRMAPSPAVVAYVASLPVEEVFTAAICEAEIRYGLARLPAGRRRDELTARMDDFFDIGFRDRILRFDRVCASVYGEIRAGRDAGGQPIASEDAMIAATARAYGMSAVVTRNTKDFGGCGVELIDPWKVV